MKHTRIITLDCCFHKCLHPLADDCLFIGAEIVRAIRLVHQLESISPGVYMLICDKTIANDVDVSFDLCLLSSPAY
jgi:hypothetical protein